MPYEMMVGVVGRAVIDVNFLAKETSSRDGLASVKSAIFDGIFTKSVV